MAHGDNELTITRRIQAPPARVWKAWSVPEHLARWWIPAPYTCRVETLDLRPGGGFVTRMREGDGAFQPHLDACFLDVEPESRLAFTTMLTGGWRPAEPWLAITAIITLAPEGDATRYTARVLHRSADDARKHVEMGFEQGWGTVLDQLNALVGREP